MIDTQLFMGILALLFAGSLGCLWWLWRDGKENTRWTTRNIKHIQQLEEAIVIKDNTITKLAKNNSIKYDKIYELQQKIKHKNQTIMSYADRVQIALECRTPGSNGTVVKMCEILDGTRERMSEYRKVAQKAANEWGKPVYVYSNDAGHFTHTMEKRAPSLMYKKYRFSVKPHTDLLSAAKDRAQANANRTGEIHGVYSYAKDGRTRYIIRNQNLISLDKLKTTHEYKLVGTYGAQPPQVTS